MCHIIIISISINCRSFFLDTYADDDDVAHPKSEQYPLQVVKQAGRDAQGLATMTATMCLPSAYKDGCSMWQIMSEVSV